MVQIPPNHGYNIFATSRNVVCVTWYTLTLTNDITFTFGSRGPSILQADHLACAGEHSVSLVAFISDSSLVAIIWPVPSLYTSGIGNIWDVAAHPCERNNCDEGLTDQKLVFCLVVLVINIF